MPQSADRQDPAGQPYLVVGTSVRGLVQSAKAAGHAVIAMDAFGDVDTRQSAGAFEPLPLHGLRVNGVELVRRVRNLGARRPLAGLVYGSGLETQVSALQALTELLPVFGNAPSVFAAAQSPEQLRRWLAGSPVRFPETRTARPADSEAWLIKPLAGSGGSGIQTASSTTAGPDEVYQRRVRGLSLSAQFLANGERACVLGVHQQWCRPDNSEAGSFLHGGAASRPDLPAGLTGLLESLVQRLTAAAGLRGLNGVDCVYDGQVLWLLELNARPCASLDLYDAALPGGLFHWHLRASAGELPATAPDPVRRAYQILYADHELRVPRGLQWPSWATDRPAAGTRIMAGAPVCTVHGDSGDIESRYAELADRQQRVLEGLRGDRRPLWRRWLGSEAVATI